MCAFCFFFFPSFRCLQDCSTGGASGCTYEPGYSLTKYSFDTTPWVRPSSFIPLPLIRAYLVALCAYLAVLQTTADHRDPVRMRVQGISLYNAGNATFTPDLMVGTEQVGSSEQKSQAFSLILPGLILIDLAPGLFFFLKNIAFRKYETAVSSPS